MTARRTAAAVAPVAGAFHHDLLGLLARGCRQYLEVGVQEGDSLAAVVRANRGIGVTLCDTWGLEFGGTGRGGHAHIDERLDALRHAGARTYMDGPSRTSLRTLSGLTFDLVHIDGDHSAEGVHEDLRLAWPLAARWVVLHDMFFGEVREGVFGFLATLRDGAPEGPFGVASIGVSLHGHGTMVIEKEAGPCHSATGASMRTSTRVSRPTATRTTRARGAGR